GKAVKVLPQPNQAKTFLLVRNNPAVGYDVAVAIDHRPLRRHSLRQLLARSTCRSALSVESRMCPSPFEQRYRRDAGGKTRGRISLARPQSVQYHRSRFKSESAGPTTKPC